MKTTKMLKSSTTKSKNWDKLKEEGQTLQLGLQAHPPTTFDPKGNTNNQKMNLKSQNMLYPRWRWQKKDINRLP